MEALPLLFRIGQIERTTWQDVVDSKSRRLAYAQHRAAFIGRSHRSCASATLFPPAMDEASRGQPSTFNRAYWIEYSSRQLRDFTRPAMQADLKKTERGDNTDMGVHGHAFDQNHGRPSP